RDALLVFALQVRGDHHRPLDATHIRRYGKPVARQPHDDLGLRLQPRVDVVPGYHLVAAPADVLMNHEIQIPGHIVAQRRVTFIKTSAGVGRCVCAYGTEEQWAAGGAVKTGGTFTGWVWGRGWSRDETQRGLDDLAGRAPLEPGYLPGEVIHHRRRRGNLGGEKSAPHIGQNRPGGDVRVFEKVFVK